MRDETEPDRPWKICRTCGYPLERDSGARLGEKEWLHVRTDEAYLHDVEPINIVDGDLKQRCDFCDREQASDVILAKSFDLPDRESRSVGPWAACEQCAEMVRRGRWGQLVTYVKRNGGMAAREMSRAYFVRLYDLVERNMYGVISQADWKKRADYPGRGPTLS